MDNIRINEDFSETLDFNRNQDNQPDKNFIESDSENASPKNIGVH